MEYTQRVWIMYTIVFSLNFLTVNKLSTERHFIVNPNMSSKFGSKGMLLWKRGSTLVSTEDTKLLIPYWLMWFNGPRPPKRFP